MAFRISPCSHRQYWKVPNAVHKQQVHHFESSPQATVTACPSAIAFGHCFVSITKLEMLDTPLFVFSNEDWHRRFVMVRLLAILFFSSTILTSPKSSRAAEIRPPCAVNPRACTGHVPRGKHMLHGLFGGIPPGRPGQPAGL